MIRPLSVADIERIMELEVELFGPDAWSAALYREELARPDRRWRGTEEDGELLAYGGITIGPQADLMTIGVAAGHQGSGHGRALLDALIAEAAGAGVRELFLEVRADNSIAQRLYLSAGFEELGIRPRYYRGGIDAVVMRLRLAAEPPGPVGSTAIT